MYSRQRSLLENIIIKCKLKSWPCWAQHLANILYPQPPTTAPTRVFIIFKCLFAYVSRICMEGLISHIRNVFSENESFFNEFFGDAQNSVNRPIKLNFPQILTTENQPHINHRFIIDCGEIFSFFCRHRQTKTSKSIKMQIGCGIAASCCCIPRLLKWVASRMCINEICISIQCARNDVQFKETEKRRLITSSADG